MNSTRKNSRIIVAVLLLTILSSVSVFGFKTFKKSGKKVGLRTQQNTGEKRAETVPNQIVIKFKDQHHFGTQLFSTGITPVDKLLRDYNVTKLGQVFKRRGNSIKNLAFESLENIYYVYFSGDYSPASVASTLNVSPNIEYAEPLYYHYLNITPDDSLFSQQAFHSVIKTEQAWDAVKGEQGDVVIAVVDGGTDIEHPDLEANIWINKNEIPNNGLDDDENGFVDDTHGWNFADSTNNPAGLPATPQSADHGTLTAGLAAAVTNNLTGVSGVSWNAKLMAINAASPNEDLVIQHGPRGIVYAAENGADVINLSYGRAGGPSAFEQDIINMAVQSGAAIVAAAGNASSSIPEFPASYENVLSVAATKNDDGKAGFSNYGTHVDLAAPGSLILSTKNYGKYGKASGTSFSSPIVAGVVGLVKTQHPEWLGLQAGEQVRVTADNIDDKNPNLTGLLGKGRVNAFRAVTEVSPSVRITNVQFSESNGDGVIEPGETVEIILTLKNFLADVSNLNLLLTVDDNFVTLTNANVSLSSINTMEEKAIATPLSFSVLSSAPSGHPVNLKLEISSGPYQDFDYFNLTILPAFESVAVNNIEVTVTNVGRIGFADLNSSDSGIGFKFKNGPNLLYEGAIIAGTSADQISNAARNGSGFDDDFNVVDGGDLQVITPGTMSDQESMGIFNDSQAGNPMNIRITQETFAMNTTPNDDFILFRYYVENQSANALSNFHFGIFYDWDIDGRHSGSNITEFDAARKLGYAYDTSSGGPDTYAGMSLLTEGSVSYRAIYNDDDDPGNPYWGLHDGFTDSEKWESISSGVQITKAGPADVSFVIAAGPFSIQPNELIQLGFALVAGENLSDIQANAEAAKSFWDKLFVTTVDDENPVIPTEFSLKQNYPNPFNPTTAIGYDLPRVSDVHLTVYNMRGQKIRTLVNERQRAGFHSIQWDGKNDAAQAVASSVYVYQFIAGDFKQSRKLLLIR